jgi:hypothetical protein
VRRLAVVAVRRFAVVAVPRFAEPALRRRVLGEPVRGDSAI